MKLLFVVTLFTLSLGNIGAALATKDCDEGIPKLTGRIELVQNNYYLVLMLENNTCQKMNIKSAAFNRIFFEMQVTQVKSGIVLNELRFFDDPSPDIIALEPRGIYIIKFNLSGRINELNRILDNHDIQVAWQYKSDDWMTNISFQGKGNLLIKK